MTNPTTPFSWQMPTSTDLVTDLPADFETFGQAVATSMADLLGGTTGQVLSKASNTNMDFSWVTTDDANAIQNAIVDAKGDIIAATANDTPARLAVGATNKLSLQVDSTTATGLAWKQQGMTLISRSSFSNVASQTFDNVFDSTVYRAYQIVIEGVAAATQTDDLWFQFRYGTTTQATGYYGTTYGYPYNSSTLQIVGMNNANQLTINQDCGSLSYPTSATLTVTLGGNNNVISVVGGSYAPAPAVGQTVQAGCSTPQNYTGFLLKSSSTNIDGTVAIYGLAI